MDNIDKLIFINEVIGSCNNLEQIEVCVNWINNLVDRDILNKYDQQTLRDLVDDMQQDIDYVPRSDFDQLTEEEQKRELDNLIPGELYE